MRAKTVHSISTIANSVSEYLTNSRIAWLTSGADSALVTARWKSTSCGEQGSLYLCSCMWLLINRNTRYKICVGVPFIRVLYDIGPTEVYILNLSGVCNLNLKNSGPNDHFINHLSMCDGVDAVAFTRLQGLEAFFQPGADTRPIMLQALVQHVPNVVVGVGGESQHRRPHQTVHQLAAIFSVEGADKSGASLK